MARKIITFARLVPDGHRGPFEWSAHFAGEEYQLENHGVGATEAEALEDFQRICAERATAEAIERDEISPYRDEIITSYDTPLLPGPQAARYAWRAFFAVEEEQPENYGYGSTEAEALEDFAQLCAERATAEAIERGEISPYREEND